MMVKIDSSKVKGVYIRELGIKTRLITGVKLEDSFNFECQKCGSCCYHPSAINPKELSRAANYLGISNAEFFHKYTEMHEDSLYGWKVKFKEKNGHCVFLEKNDKASCMIYPVRTRQCRGKPVVSIYGLSIDPCKGLDKGSEYTVEEWIRMNDLEAGWKEEREYLDKIKSLKFTENKDRLMIIIMNLFT
jgi:Fe-S-cluster containining protein